MSNLSNASLAVNIEEAYRLFGVAGFSKADCVNIAAHEVIRAWLTENNTLIKQASNLAARSEGVKTPTIYERPQWHEREEVINAAEPMTAEEREWYAELDADEGDEANEAYFMNEALYERMERGHLYPVDNLIENLSNYTDFPALGLTYLRNAVRRAVVAAEQRDPNASLIADWAESLRQNAESYLWDYTGGS
jgi:hypothetical protein